MLERAYLDNAASDPKAVATTGSTICHNRSLVFANPSIYAVYHGLIPDTGNHCSLNPKKKIRRSASQNVGMAYPVNTITVVTRSKSESLFTALTMPKGTAIHIITRRDTA